MIFSSLSQTGFQFNEFSFYKTKEKNLNYITNAQMYPLHRYHHFQKRVDANIFVLRK